MKNKESIFFQNLKIILGEKFIKAKILSKPVKKEDVFLDKNYIKYQFNYDINKIFVLALNELLCNESIPDGSLSHYVDGLIYNHPIFGKRIIEFDEEQHFNPFRKETLKYLSDSVLYKKVYSEHCNDLTCFHRMLCKIRIKYFPNYIPQNTVIFQDFIEKNKMNENGYINKTNGFKFCGGRIAQRAYYDLLRDYAHLAKQNNDLSPTLRFSLFEIESTYCKSFNNIKDSEIQEFIITSLNLLK